MHTSADGTAKGASILGNDAVVRGALEAGVGFATGYPGTPSSEITDGFAALAERAGVHFEYGVNEKICVELAFGASLAGARAICAMKHLGLMAAGDPISTIPYVGVNAGMLIVSAADPSCLTSPNEQDQRHLGKMLHVPVLDPGDPAEAHRLTKLAFELSEDCRLPVLLRITTRVAHTKAWVPFGEIEPRPATGFERDPKRLLPIPTHARRLRQEIHGRLDRARAVSEGLYEEDGEGRTAVIMAGAPASTTLDLIEELGPGEPIITARLPCVYPLPEAALGDLLGRVDRALVVEELSPFVEDELSSLCSRLGHGTTILGKHSGHFPVEFEYEPAVIRGGLAKLFGIEGSRRESETLRSDTVWGDLPLFDLAQGEPSQSARKLPVAAPRPPELCAGCPHRASFYAAKVVFGDDHLYFNDIGCYTLGSAPPLLAGDALLCMGASITLASGASKVTGERAVSFIGDSTFFHSGMPALVDAIKEQADIVAVVLDNEVTAMTGFQESPAVAIALEGEPERRVSIEGIVKALGAEHVERFDPHDLNEAIMAFERAKAHHGVSVLITESPCPLFYRRAVGSSLSAGVYTIDQSLCAECGRTGCGMDCGQPPVVATERNMGRNRSLETRDQPPTGVAACAVECPLGICIQGYASHVAAGEYSMALELIMSQNPLPDSVCRVCHAPCEIACIRSDMDGPVAVNDLKRFVMDWAAEQPEPPYRPEPDAPHEHWVAVIGAGPAGLSAAHDLVLRGFSVTLFDRAEHPGGMLRHGIPGFRLPAEALERDIARIIDMGVEFVGGRTLGQNLDVETLLASGYDAAVLAIGAQRPIRPDLRTEPGGPETIDALDYLAGQHHLAHGQRVVVVGAGNAGVDVARTTIRSGALVVTVIDQQSQIPALRHEAQAAADEGVNFRMGWRPVRLTADSGLICAPPEEHVRAASASELEIPADLVIFSTGQAVDRDAVQTEGLGWTESSTLRIDAESGSTSHTRVFAAGDMVPADRTVTEAMASGRRAAWGVDVATRGRAEADRRTPPPPSGRWPSTRLAPPPLSRSDVVIRSDAPEQKARVLHVPELHAPALTAAALPAPGRDPMAEVARTLDEAAARTEARRCMLCGSCASCRACLDTFGCPAFFAVGSKVQIDPNLCTGCGDCAAFCPNGAIHLIERGQS